jgi:sulfonate transport system substrate-binding protein
MSTTPPMVGLSCTTWGCRFHAAPAARWIATTLLIALLLPAAGATDDGTGSPTVIRFGISNVGVGGVPFVGGHVIGSAHAKGLLEEEFRPDGIRIEWLFHKGAGPAVNEDLAAGKLDIAWQGDLPALIGRSAGLRTRVLMAANRHGATYLAVPTGSPAHSLKDLVGKRVVMFKGTASQLVIDRILAQQGLSERDFRFITLESSAAYTALTSGEVDGVWGTLALFDLRDRGLIRFVFTTHDPPPSPNQPWASSQTLVLATEDFLDRHADLVQRIITVLVKEAAWAADPAHQDELYALWSKSGTSAAHYLEEYGAMPLSHRLSPLLDDEFISGLAGGMHQAVALHLLRAEVDLQAWCDARFLEHAIAELKTPNPWLR